MLSNTDIEILAERMEIPLVFCGYKSDLPKRIETNKSYIINLDNEYDLDGKMNEGSHWTCFQVTEYPNGRKEAIYMDSFAQPPPEIVKMRLRNSLGINYVPYTKRNIQSAMNQACGWFCLAFLHFINVFQGRSPELYDNVVGFLDMFDDLDKSIDFKKNEYILKMFFQAKDKKLRKPIEVMDQELTEQFVNKTKDDVAVPMKVDIKYV
jgi:hypothetical protein